MKLRAWFLIVSVALVLGVVAVTMGASAPAGTGLYRLVGLVGQAVALVRSSYVEEVDTDRLELGALAGMVEAVDPGGAWVPAEELEAFERVAGRELPPFGLVLGKRSSYPFVLQVLPGSPAAEAGLKPGEMIERVESVAVRARPVWRALVALGDAERAGRDVTLVVIDRQLSGTRTAVLKAGELRPAVPTVEVRDGVPLVRLGTVGREAAAALKGQLEAHRDAEGVVVDLRQLALGDPAAAPEVAALLVGGRVETRLGRRDGEGRTLAAEAEARRWRVAACVDHTTARAGELVALLLKARGVPLVGFQTYGDTGVRRTYRTSEGRLWLAEEWALGADGKPLLGSGLAPDELVRMRPDADPVLDRALELARGAAPKKAS
ncbi:MAG TPA: PDZ domain-containing protein [Thermoanaerobaculaceae bacterium]|nr:PDZ domain-containing protein [Thermoanaerobaculaceae bacterium]HRS16327.1 PDZ domain-containing protein [Thermoanaerobaculaceae bacterium]